MAPSYRVRRAARADVALLPAIERASGVLFPPGRLPDPDDALPVAELEQAREAGLLLVAAGADGPVGFAASKVLDGYLHLAQLSVHPDHGRRGLGTRLVEAVVRQAARRKLAGVTLTTFRDLPWNAPFYAKRGFRILPPSEVSPALHALLANEARLGLTDRVAMRYEPGVSRGSTAAGSRRRGRSAPSG